MNDKFFINNENIFNNQNQSDKCGYGRIGQAQDFSNVNRNQMVNKKFLLNLMVF